MAFLRKGGGKWGIFRVDNEPVEVGKRGGIRFLRE
jgi:hypothetical protein